MSAFALIYERADPPDPGKFERVMARLRHRGPDGRDIASADHVILGHWHFWVTPEELGERQPLALHHLPFKIVLDGRLDNRAELISQLGLNPAEAQLLSDAALMLHAYARWQADCFAHFIGEFALVIFDQHRGELLCARDALGDRTLFYSVNSTGVVIASEPWAVAAAHEAACVVNETAVAHYFALKAPPAGQTLFTNIHELLPAHALLVNGAGERGWCYWQPTPDLLYQPGRKKKPDAEYAEEFRALLEESVHCRLRSTTPVGVLMSGGLDSASVASLAARIIAPQPLTTISYVFNELAECDERNFINTMVTRWGIRSLQLPCDDIWPLKDWQNWRINPNQPEGNAYRLLKERAYQRAQAEGVRVLLSGAFGDNLYMTGEDWLADLLATGRFLDAVGQLRLQAHYTGWRRTLSSVYLRRVVRRALEIFPGGGRLLRARRQAPPWLTSFAAGSLSESQPDLVPAFERYFWLLGALSAWDSSQETFNTSRHAVELRDPYRDRRLIEYVLSLPAYQLYYNGAYKQVLRLAMQDILPEAIRVRRERTSLISLFIRGIERERETWLDCLHEPDAHWRKFVRADWLAERLNVQVTPEMDGPELMVRWLCVSYMSWHKFFVHQYN